MLLPIDMSITTLFIADTMNPVVTICMTVPHLEQETDNDITKQTQILATIREQYTPEVWTNV